MNKEELLEEAKRKYPIGTVIKLSNGSITEIKKNIYFDTAGDNIIWNDGYGRIYNNGKWAEIVSKPEEKPHFEVGKWYKSNRNTYGKFLRIGNALSWYFITSERITNCGYSKDEYGFNNDKKWELLTDLSEIQDYLPEGHSDKIVKPKSLVGRYLKALVDYPSAGDVKKGEYGKITSDHTADFPSQKGYACEVAILMVSNSNTIYDGRYELMPEGFEPLKEEFKEEIPEYLECIPSEFSQSYAILGRIYKFVKTSGKHWGVECNLDCAGYDVGSVLYFYPEQFKPSTKEAYDRQQPIKKQWIPKVGDWVVSLVDREGYRKKGDVFQVLKISDGCIYYVQNTNGYINTFRPAEPHEIPKENKYIIGVDPIKETKPEIDSWCIQLTEENRELLLQNKHVFKADWSFDNLKHYYGITKFNVPSYYIGITHFDKVLTTEEFCKKFNITESYKQVEIDFSVGKIIEKNQQSKINKVKVELIPVKKLIKN